MRHHLRRWGAVYFLAAVALVLNGVHGWLEHEVAEYPTQDAVPWKLEWARATFENLESEMWQIVVACLVVDAAIQTRRWFQAKND